MRHGYKLLHLYKLYMLYVMVLESREDRRGGWSPGVILALISSIALALGHDDDGRPDERGGYDGQSSRIWPTNV